MTNSTNFHQFKPLSDFIYNPSNNFQELENSFNYIDPTYTIQALTNINTGGYTGYGWIHNYNYFWRSTWILENSINFSQNCAPNCCSPSTATNFDIEGLIPNHGYHLDYYPTRMNGQILPASYSGVSDASGILHVPINYTLGCDTITSDYAYSVSYVWPRYSCTDTVSNEFNENIDFIVYPNPSHGNVSLFFSKIGEYQCKIISTTGKIFSIFTVNGNTFTLNNTHLDSGMYYLVVNSGKNVIAKKNLIE